MVPIKRQLDNDDHYDGQNNIQYIVVHDTGNITDTDEGNANYFCSGSRQSSAHYFVDEDSITQIVEDFNGAWHCGDGNGAYGITNRNSLGIEMCNSGGCIAERTIQNTLDLIRMKMAQYNVPIDRVVRHYDASRKICPHNMSANNWAKWWEFKSRLAGTSVTPIPSTSICITFGNSGVVVQNLQAKLNKLGYGLAVDGDFGNATYNAVKNFQTKHGLTVDGVVGNQTMGALDKVISQISQVTYGVVSATTLNVRSGAGTGYGVIGQLTKGQTAKLDKKVGNWWSIYFGNHGGYVSADYITLK